MKKLITVLVFIFSGLILCFIVGIAAATILPMEFAPTIGFFAGAFVGFALFVIYTSKFSEN
jgi:positive regulator of sigma E activity